jgi:hypothetical protein
VVEAVGQRPGLVPLQIDPAEDGRKGADPTLDVCASNSLQNSITIARKNVQSGWVK